MSFCNRHLIFRCALGAGVCVGAVFSLLACLGLLHPQPSRAEDGTAARSRFELDEIVVTATKVEDQVKDIPKNVTVITSEDIAQASSSNLVDLLGREAGVSVRSFFGNDKQAGVDIRGMGETFGSNVVVMVDGVRLNSPDLSGPDLSSIPLDQIERIEIVRGGGSVLYGDGAVGGVVNILTKRGEKSPEGDLGISYGSYDTLDSRASYGAAPARLGFQAYGGYFDSEGYRDNGYLRKGDASGKVSYELSDHVNLGLTGAHHEDDFGLPGAVSREDMDSRDRRTRTDRPEDWGKTRDQRVVGRVGINLDRWGDVTAHRGYRFRDETFILGFNPLLSRQEQEGEIDEETKDLDADYVVEYGPGERRHRLQCGVDHYRTEYVREDRSKNQRENSRTESLGVYVSNRFYLTQDLAAQAGYRHSRYEGRFRTDERQTFSGVKRWVNGDQTAREFNHDPYDIGLVYDLTEETSLFGNYSTSFRVPNVDEFAQAQDDLRPQKGRHIDAGFRHRFKGAAELSSSFYEIEIEDEIFFDGALQLNRNFEDKTVRRGVEIDLRLFPVDNVYLWGNYAYTEARFENKDTFVPLVPKHKATVGMEWRVVEPFLLSMTGTYVGSKFDGNDQDNNRFAKVEGYAVLDAKLTYERKGLKVFAGVNNVFDEVYSTVAFSETYYPMPERNYYMGVVWSF